MTRGATSNEPDWVIFIVAMLLLAALVGGSACCGQVVYGDPRCGFAQCRIEVDP